MTLLLWSVFYADRFTDEAVREILTIAAPVAEP
jgi:hypothetical protein